MTRVQAPVLFIVFRRPDTTQRVFDAIRRARPARLFVAADGPRSDKERKLCDKVRAIATNVDWPCDVMTLFREANLGVRQAVTEALDWFFDEVEDGIILEDDCLPHPTFFRFCDNLLNRYRDHERVMSISGDCFHGSAIDVDSSYFYSRYCFVWGWATWRRAWQHNEADMSDWPRLRETGWLDEVGDGHADFRRFWSARFDETHSGEIDTWAYVWIFSCWLRSGLCAVPTRNLVKNIGIGNDASHTLHHDWRSDLPLESVPFPLHHPGEVTRNREADRWADLNVYDTQFSLSTLRRIAHHIPGGIEAGRFIRNVRRSWFGGGHTRGP